MTLMPAERHAAAMRLTGSRSATPFGAERGVPSTKAFCMSTFTSAVRDGIRSNAAIIMLLQSQLAIHGTFSMQVFQLIVGFPPAGAAMGRGAVSLASLSPFPGIFPRARERARCRVHRCRFLFL